MGSNVIELTLEVEKEVESLPGNSSATDTVMVTEAWKDFIDVLNEDEQKSFSSNECNSLQDYLDKLKVACERNENESLGLEIAQWFQPILSLTDLLIPAANVAVGAHPNPASLIVGGIVGILSVTKRIVQFQKLTIQMLAKMGRKAKILREYEKELYQDNTTVQLALIQVYKDILTFCRKAFRFLTDKGQILAKVKGFRLILIKDYQDQLGKEVKDFENHMEELEALANLCDRSRLKALYDNQKAQQKEMRDMVSENQDRLQLNNDLMVNLWKSKQASLEQEERRRKEEEKKNLLHWLSPLDFDASYEQRCEEHLDGTGSWFLNSDLYMGWKASKESELLWVRGKPGCGKSVLAAVAITDVKTNLNPDMALAFAFCRSQDESSKGPAIFNALVKQISEQQMEIDPSLDSEFIAAQRGQKKPTRKTAFSILNSARPYFNSIFLIIDGLDECHDNMEMAKDLLELIQIKTASPVKILVFSRPDFHLDESFRQYPKLQPDLGANEDDLKEYIKSLFPDKEDSQGSINAEIREECISKADGMFLWVKLVAQSLQKPLSSKQKLKRIKEIPPRLESLYDHFLKTISDQEDDIKSTAFLVLMWVIHARRPLDKFEMLEAVADYSDVTTFEELQSCKQASPEDLVVMCSNLVYIDKDDDFRLCHDSVRDYLENTGPEMTKALRDYHKLRKDVNKHLATICLSYLRLKEFERGPAKTFGKLVSLVKKYRFLQYAARFWGVYVTPEVELSLQDLILEVVNSQPRREISMQIALWDASDDQDDLWTYVGTSNPLHILSLFGLKQTAESLQDIITLSQEGDGSGIAPLEYSLIRGHHDMSLWIIEQVRSTHMLLLEPERKSAAAFFAAVAGWADVLKILLAEEEQFINGKLGDEGITALIGACQVGGIEAVQTLIDHRADVNLEDGDGDTPLIVATVNRHANLVELLLKNKADPNHSNSDGVSALHYAAEHDNAHIAKALLENGADPLAMAPKAGNQNPWHIAAENDSFEVIKALHNVQPNSGIAVSAIGGLTPLQVAAYYNSSRAAEVLIELGAPKDDTDDDGETALYTAARQGNLKTVKVLLEAGCDVTIENKSGRTALHAAAHSGKLFVARRILRNQSPESHKSLVNKSCEGGETPLHAAVDGGNTEILELFLKAGADGSVKGNLKATPLHYAAYYGHKSMSILLLQNTMEPNPRDTDNDTPLHFAARKRKLDFIKQYLKDCSKLGLQMDINAQNNFKETPLMTALLKGFEDVSKFLMDNGAISIPDDSNYPIHIAAWNGFDSIVEALLQSEGTTKQGYSGRTPLQCAAIQGKLNTLKLLVPVSGEVLNLQDEVGTTPVLAALMGRHFEATNYLLDIGADHNVLDEHGNGLLHIATEFGDLSMVQRLLDLGCKGDTPNIYGETPLDKAVLSDNMEVVDALIEAGFKEALNVPNVLGDFCNAYAATRGNLEMLQKIESVGSRRTSHNVLNRNSAFAAAYGGHVNILEYLKDQGESLTSVDIEGNCPLNIAANGGYVEAVEYLIKNGSPSQLECLSWDRTTPLLQASSRGYPEVMQKLLTAGADPYCRDAYGLNSLDYAANHRSLLKEMHNAGHFYNPDSLEEQGWILCNTIQQCCKDLLQFPLKDPTAEDLSIRVTRIHCLAKALQRIQDYDTAKAIFMEVLWPPKFDSIGITVVCYLCDTKGFDREGFICKSCNNVIALCSQCHEDYKENGNKLPTALEEVLGLEKLIQRVRAAIPDDMSLYNSSNIMNYFLAGSKWVAAAASSYDEWEQKYNNGNKYEELERPGQQFIKMIKDMRDLLVKEVRGGVVDPEDVNRFVELSEKWVIQRRKHRADKEIEDCICEGHEFFLVSRDEQKSLQSEGTLETDTGRVSASFLQSILEKYGEKKLVGHDQLEHLLSRRFSQPTMLISNTGLVKEGGFEVTTEHYDKHRPRTLKRSTTTTDLKPTKKLSTIESIPVTDDHKSRRPVIPLTLNQKPKELRKAQTFPLPTTNDNKMQEYNVEMKDTRAFAAMKALFDPDCDEEVPQMSESGVIPTVKKSVSISLAAEADSPGGLIVGTIVSTESAGVTEGHVIALALNEEPESTMTLQIEEEIIDLTESPDSTVSTLENTGSGNDDNDFESIAVVTQLAYLTVHNEEPNDEDVWMWTLALHVTEAMFPDFVEGYFQFKVREREEAEEEEEEEEEDSGRDNNSQNQRDDDDDDDDEEEEDDVKDQGKQDIGKHDEEDKEWETEEED